MQQDDGCPICMCAYTENKVFFSCTHAFNKPCIQEYCKGKIKNGQDIQCPVCRNTEILKGSRDYEYLASRLLPDMNAMRQNEIVQVVVHIPSPMLGSSSNRRLKIPTISRKKVFFVCSVVVILVILAVILFELNHE